MDEPWMKSYPKGVRYDAPLLRMPVWQIFDEAVSQWPDRPAIDFMEKKLTYRELSKQVDRAAAGFRELGVKPGVHVGLYLPNTPHYIVSFFGILKAGGTVVNYSPLDTAKQLTHKIEDSETDIMVTLDVKSLYPMMAPLLQSTRLRTLVVAASGMPCDVAWGEGHVAFEKLLANEGRGTPPEIANLDEAIAVLQYTGGTSGQPKGAMLTHANLSAACSQYREIRQIEPATLKEGEERVLVALPLFHIYALTVDMLLGLRLGAELVLMPRFEAELALREIASKKITLFPAVPTMFSAILNHPEAARYDLSSLKFCGSGGAPLPLEVQQRFERLSGCRVCEGWGMTETSPTGTFTPETATPRPGSCGLPIPGVRLQFTDLNDPSKTVPLGERGEICIAGPNVMKGYWKSERVTAESTTADGFFRTGDVGYMDEDGFVYIVDRTKDMLLCGGFNVYPRNIEEAIYEHPSVAEVSVIGIDDAYRGQAPKAFIKLKAGAPELTLDELKAFLQGRLGKHEMVQAMAIRAELPKTLVGKLSKKELYEEEKAARAAAAGSPLAATDFQRGGEKR